MQVNLLPKVLEDIVLDYDPRYKIMFNDTVDQLNRYGFGIQYLPVLKFARVRDFGLPHMMHRTRNAFITLLRNPDHDVLLTDPHGFSEDFQFNYSTWEDLIDELVCLVSDEHDSPYVFDDS